MPIMSPESTTLVVNQNSEAYKFRMLLPEFIPFVVNVVQQVTEERVGSGEIPLMFAHSARSIAQWCCGNCHRAPEEQRADFNKVVDRYTTLYGEELFDLLEGLGVPYKGEFNVTEKFHDRIMKMLGSDQELDNSERMLVNEVINKYAGDLQAIQQRKPKLGFGSPDIFNVMDQLRAMGFNTSSSDYYFRFNKERVIAILQEKKRPDLVKIVYSGPKQPRDGD